MANVLTLTTPLMRQTVGFDRFNDLFESLMRETSDGFDNYPPYNIEKLGDNQYRITMAVAGFRMEDLAIVLEDGELTISGDITGKQSDAEDAQVHFLHRGIATRSFSRRFRLADHIQVDGAHLQDGLLMIHLCREVPEEKRPRMIQIDGSPGRNLLGGKKK